MPRRALCLLLVLSPLPALLAPDPPGEAGWKKHVIRAGLYNTTAVAGDFTGRGKADVICPAGGKVRLFVAPGWKEIVIDDTPGRDAIHSAALDVDGDGKLDFIGAG